MPPLSKALRAALDAVPALWPVVDQTDAKPTFEGLLQALPADVCDAVVAGLVDPEQHLWARGAVLGLARLLHQVGPEVDGAPAHIVGMANDDVIELEDERGGRFGFAPLGVAVQPHPIGEPDDVAQLLAVLDGIFGSRGYTVHISRRLPKDFDVQPVARAVRLWLSELGRGQHDDLHAKYEDEGVCIDFTLAAKGSGKGRILTLGPLDALDRLHALERQLIDAVVKHEQSLGDLPLVVALTSNQPWSMPRGYVQVQLYGPAQHVMAGGGGHYEAWFPRAGGALFQDRIFANMVGLWWLEPSPSLPGLAGSFRAHDNPWARTQPELAVPGRRFGVVDVAADGIAHMRWEG